MFKNFFSKKPEDFKSLLRSTTCLSNVEGYGTEKVLFNPPSNEFSGLLIGYVDNKRSITNDALKARIKALNSAVDSSLFNEKFLPVNDFNKFHGQPIMTTSLIDGLKYRDNTILIIPKLEGYEDLDKIYQKLGKKGLGSLLGGLPQSSYDDFIYNIVEDAKSTGVIPDLGTLGNIMTDSYSLVSLDKNKVMGHSKFDIRRSVDRLLVKINKNIEPEYAGGVFEKLDNALKNNGINTDFTRAQTEFGLGAKRYVSDESFLVGAKPTEIITELMHNPVRLSSSIKDVADLAHKTKSHLGFNR